jgi:hypothetical protein
MPSVGERIRHHLEVLVEDTEMESGQGGRRQGQLLRPGRALDPLAEEPDPLPTEQPRQDGGAVHRGLQSGTHLDLLRGHRSAAGQVGRRSVSTARQR